ncbi:NAD(P)H-dependent oxidoreductase [Streptomyces sp. NRRL F-2305]|uniref:NAD(P)H-dependent oxidoreductase n=1 Tax=Streptomyces TaxID=1883 RepID=UPI000AD3A995
MPGASHRPDRGDREKAYSDEAHAHVRRILDAGVVAVFPMYRQSAPAVLKGWIDHVGNHGFARGRSGPRLAGKRVLWLGLAGATADEPVVEGMRTVSRPVRVKASPAAAASPVPPSACSPTRRSVPFGARRRARTRPRAAADPRAQALLERDEVDAGRRGRALSVRPVVAPEELLGIRHR